MRIALSQINTTPGAFDQTVERMVAQSQRAAEQGADLVVFPLAALAGVDAVPYADSAAYMRDVAEAAVALAERLACPAIVPVPMDMGLQEGSFDALLIEDGEMRPLRLKAQPDAVGRGQAEVAEFEFGGLRMALAFSHADLDALCDYDYDVDAVVFLSGYPFAMDDPSSFMGADLENARFVGDACTIGAWLVGSAPVGGYGDQVFSGSSFVLTPSGDLVALAPAFEEALTVTTLYADYTPGHAIAVTPEVFDAPFHLWQAVSLGIHDFVTKQGLSDVALCLDGSLDASVLAALASDAVGPLHVHALIGASAGGAAPTCRDLARRLRIDQHDAAGRPLGLDVRDLDELELAALAREQNAVVLSSLDKTALALGAHGTHVSSALLCPLGDVYRSDVLDMAHVRNTISPLFRRVALAEQDSLALVLPDGSQIDVTGEAQVTRVDEILLGYVEYDRPLAELVAASDDGGGLARAVLRTERISELRRRALPPVLVMSTHTLDDARFPLGVSWHDTHADDAPDAFDALLAGVRDGAAGDEDDGAEQPSAPEVDIDSTLAMLRDLAEQGGFLPTEFAQMGGVPGGPQGSTGADGNPLGWMTPFSEN